MTQHARHVRIGIAWRGHIISERVLRRRTAVSIGHRADATIQVSATEHPDFPAHMDLLRLSGGRYHLVLPQDPQANVTLRGAPVPNLTVDIDGRRCLPVEAAAGGSLAFGDLCIMFQFVSGYSQPMAVRERTVLRLGLVFEERLISDRLFSEGDTVSVGGANADDIVLDQDYRGPSLAFRRHRDGTATLTADQGVVLRMALPGDRPEDTDELLRRGHAQLKGSQLRSHLPLGSRGRLRMGPYSVLFQVLKQRVEVPVMPRRGWTERVQGLLFRDPVWSACLALCFGLAGVVSVQAWAFHHTVGQYLRDIQPAEDDGTPDRTRFIEVPIVVPDVPKPEPEPLAPAAPPEKLADKLVPKAAKTKAARLRPVSVGQTADPNKTRRSPREVIGDRTIAGAFISRDSKIWQTNDGEGGDVHPITFGRKIGDGDGPGAGFKLKDSGRGQTHERIVSGQVGFKRDPKRILGNLDRDEKKPPKIVIDIGGGVEGGGPKKELVARVIARKQSAVRRCYEAALRNDPSLHGKVSVRFVIGTAGTVTAVTVQGANGEFQGCIERKFRAIRGLPILAAPTPFRQSYVFTKT